MINNRPSKQQKDTKKKYDTYLHISCGKCLM